MLETLDLNKRISKAEYERELLRYQVQLRELTWQLYLRKRSWWWFWKAATRRARAAAFAGSPRSSTRAAMKCFQSPRPKAKTDAPLPVALLAAAAATG